ncbi:MAG TPA: ABC transporter ATP-binding protein [Steroidobacter sp.]|uniref:ABC transporter ATP-binding protein n=1 Tax=Steroidobacter sp. TaxID=1978227 RepID=UPI002ED8CCC2
MSELAALAWPLGRMPEAVASLARCAGMKPWHVAASALPTFRETPEDEDFDRWLQHIGATQGIEVEPVEASGAEVEALLQGAGPALLRYREIDGRESGEPSVLLLLRSRGRMTLLVSPDQRIVEFPLDRVKASLCAEQERPVIADVDALLDQTNIATRRREKIKRLLVQERMAGQRVPGCWLLRIPPTASFWKQLQHQRLPSRSIAMLAIFGALFALEIAGWSLIGRSALAGQLDAGWLLAWVLLLLGTVPLRLAGGWLQGTLAIAAAVLLKQRLLTGALKMSMEEARRRGAGQWLSRVIESEALESLALSGGFAVLIATVELCLAAWILAMGAGGAWHVLLLLGWLIVTAMFARRYYCRLQSWSQARLGLTHDLIERMVGHRTRMVQQASEHRHEDEDHELDRYLTSSKDFDRAYVPLAAGVPRGWLVVGLAGLAPAFVAGSAETAGLAIALGGVLLAHRALSSIAVGLSSLLRAAVAAKEVAPLFAAASEESPSPGTISFATETNPPPAESARVLVQARDLVFRQRPQSAPVIDGCNFTIHRKDRILLEGPSGGGKSTLASLLVGLRKPESGLLLLDGLDRHTWGDTWRRLSTAAPQFHENHVLSGTLAFNLLMGRRWPPEQADLDEATELCRELGLGELLERMPSGVMQMIGETGWQLSHGERSRLYLARALLQRAELVVLDESFAALDPDTLDRCLRCALSRAPTLVVIAHP